MTEDQLRSTTTGFADLELGLSLYPWQARAVLPLEQAIGENATRQNIAIVAPNGSGKDDRIIPTAAYWWLFFNPKGKVVITSNSATQLDEQTIPSLKKHYRKFGWSDPVESPRFVLLTPTGGQLLAFVTNEGSRVEGFHKRPDEPLLFIVNEAKSITTDIFQGIDRCTPSALMLISSPGMRHGRFYECFNKLAPRYHRIKAGLADCPHITQEEIDDCIAIYGENSPYTRSRLHGEFMSQPDGEEYCLTIEELESCLAWPPQHKPGFRYGFFDFAAGRAENVFVVRNGNKYEIVDAWRETNEDAVVGRAISLIRKQGLKPEQVGADAAAKSIIDKMAEAGLAINRQNFGAQDKSGIYKSWSAMAWLQGCQKIRDREVIIPDDDVLKVQITQRKKLYSPNGKLAVEEKYAMLRSGLASPDRGDAMFGCMAPRDNTLDVPKNVIDFNQFTSRNKTDHETLGISVGL